MATVDDSYYERNYVARASPEGLLVMDAQLLARQYDRHLDSPSQRLTPEHRRLWLAEAADVLNRLVEHAQQRGLQVDAECAVVARARNGLSSLEERRDWASAAARALWGLSAKLSGALRADELDVATAWNVMMRQSRRHVSFKVAASEAPGGPGKAGAA